MTFREKLAKEQGRNVDIGCPSSYGYEKEYDCNGVMCKHCWDREMPEEKTYEEGQIKAYEQEIINKFAQAICKRAEEESVDVFFHDGLHGIVIEIEELKSMVSEIAEQMKEGV